MQSNKEPCCLMFAIISCLVRFHFWKEQSLYKSGFSQILLKHLERNVFTYLMYLYTMPFHIGKKLQGSL